MKANELMIGDWVQGNPCGQHCDRNNNTYYKIAILDIGNHCYGYSVCGSLVELKYDDVFPIPLTQEVLEKNGFEVTSNISSSGNKDVWSLRISKYKIFHITEHHNKKMFPYFWIEIGSNSDIKYVHQLQHALRLCEIEKEIIF